MFDGFKWVVSSIMEMSRNTFRSIPYVGPKKYLGDTRINNKVAIVTGGNSGIGKETARELAAREGKVNEINNYSILIKVNAGDNRLS